MTKNRLEAFSDGVIAIIITIMVLELKPPHSSAWADVRELLPLLAAYAVSFVYVGIYWNNHHHLLHTVQKVNGKILWANLHLLFWLSLFPFATRWCGEASFAPLPVAAYGLILLMAGVAYWVLSKAIIAHNGGCDSVLAKAVGHDFKGIASVVGYLAAIPLAFIPTVGVWIACGLYIAIACMWLIPDRRIENKLSEHD